MGHVDILVNCAGICLIVDILEFGKEQWDKMITINLNAAI
jgi:NAD(P)-dependent dehydrogenase (short-subunit alcohol dehydrogenase family)